MITGNHRNELTEKFYDAEYAFCEYFENRDGTKRKNEFTPALHTITSDIGIEVLWLYWERAMIKYEEVKYQLDNNSPENIEEAKLHFSKFDYLDEKEQRYYVSGAMYNRQTAISAYYSCKEYLEGLRLKIQIATHGSNTPLLPTFGSYEHDERYFPKQPAPKIDITDKIRPSDIIYAIYKAELLPAKGNTFRFAKTIANHFKLENIKSFQVYLASVVKDIKKLPKEQPSEEVLKYIIDKLNNIQD